MPDRRRCCRRARRAGRGKELVLLCETGAVDAELGARGYGRGASPRARVGQKGQEGTERVPREAQPVLAARTESAACSEDTDRQSRRDRLPRHRDVPRLGIATVAVYSDADANARHVELADEAWPIGPPPARESYLVIEQDPRRRAPVRRRGDPSGLRLPVGERGIRRGLRAAGIVFIGPPAGAIRAMGSKAAAKAMMEPPACRSCRAITASDRISRTLRDSADAHRLSRADQGHRRRRRQGDARRRAAGGFPRGAGERASARRAASFGDDRVLVEKYLTRPRHIEIQVFADTHGNGVSSVRARLLDPAAAPEGVEEAPAPGMTRDRRAAMGRCGDRRGARGRLRRRRHRRVHRRRRRASTSWR